MDWKGRNKEEVPGRVWLHTDLLQALKGERLSSVFLPDGTLISASATPNCGNTMRRIPVTHMHESRNTYDHNNSMYVESRC